MRRVLVVLLLLVGACLSDAFADRRPGVSGDRRTGVSSPSVGVTITNGIKTLVSDGAEQESGSVLPWGNYPAFPGITIAANGDLVMVYRRAAGHGLSPTTATIRSNISSDQGITWDYNRLNELEIEDDGALSDPYSPAVATMTMGSIAGELWLTYERDYPAGFPERLVFLRRSTDNGATWGAAQQIPAVGDKYTSACGKPLQLSADVVILPVYWRNQSGQGHDVGTVNGYCTTIMRTENASNASPTWAESGEIACDRGISDAHQYEETQIIKLDDDRILALIRIDNTDDPGGAPNDGSGSSQIWTAYSDDDGVTWGATSLAFRGAGWPAVIQMTDGTLVAMTRDPYDWPRELVPMMWTSTNRGASWDGPTEFGDTRLFPGLGTFPGGYMYGDLVEPAPGILGVATAQEYSDFAPTYLSYQEFGINTAPTIPYRYTQAAHLNASGSTGDVVTYGNADFLDGSEDATFFVRLRLPANLASSGNFLTKYDSAGNHTLQWYYASTRRFWIGIGYGTSSVGWWGSPVDSIVPDVNYSFMWTLNGSETGNANRFHAFINGVDVTASGSFSGTIPDEIIAKTGATWRLGGGVGATNSVRGAYLQDVAVWDSDEQANAVEMHNGGVAIDFATTSAGAPNVWLKLDGDFTDAQGVLGTPTVTGSNYLWHPDDETSTIYPFSPGYLGEDLNE